MSYEVRTPFSPHKRFFSPSPKGVVNIYEEKLLDDGTMGLKVVGKHDLNAFVQASKDSTLVYNILDKFAKTGDASILNVTSGFYADVTQLPKNLMEAQNMLISLQKRFASLDTATKDKFDNNYTKFAQAALDGSISDILKPSEVSVVEGIIDQSISGGETIESV